MCVCMVVCLICPTFYPMTNYSHPSHPTTLNRMKWILKIYDVMEMLSLTECSENKSPSFLLNFLHLFCQKGFGSTFSISHDRWNCSSLLSSFWAAMLKVRRFPAHQAAAELMNPHGPSSVLWSEYYSEAKRGKKKLTLFLCLS